MKGIFLVFNAAIEEEVMQALEKLGIECYTKFPDLHGKGRHSDPHLDTYIWPGTNHGLFMALEEEKKEELLAEIEALKLQYAKEGIKVFVFPLEAMI